MKTLASQTIANLIEFHYDQYPDSEPPVLDGLASGDWCLTRTAPDGSVTFIEVIDYDTGEFQSTARAAHETPEQRALALGLIT